jgi:ABC-type molybdenum transport system ATPase subunit/photorepair protein PhrA
MSPRAAQRRCSACASAKVACTSPLSTGRQRLVRARAGGHADRGPKRRHDARPILYLDGITVSFDGFKALNDLSLTIEDGELRCIIGPNGAGKTTMMDVITGKTRPDAGTAFFGQTIDLTR